MFRNKCNVLLYSGEGADTPIMQCVRPAVLLFPALIAGCGGSPAAAPPAAPSPVPSNPSPPPTPVNSPFAIALPIRAEDRASNAFGLNPFGIHIGDHGIDGHPGWDIEYVVGASVLAAAEGTVQSALPSEGGQAFGIQITHTIGGRDAYRTLYGVKSLAPGIAAGARVAMGQPLGTVASYTRTIGTITVTYGFTHFQLDDFSSNAGLTNHHAVSPEPFLNPEGRSAFEAIWRVAFYPHELVEPFASNARDVSFPMRRAWRLQSGSLAAAIEFTRADAFTSTFGYSMRDAEGATFETGTVELDPLAKPVSTLDFTPSGSAARRRGVYSIHDDVMHLDYGTPGGSRPANLGGASVYNTTR